MSHKWTPTNTGPFFVCDDCEAGISAVGLAKRLLEERAELLSAVDGVLDMANWPTHDSCWILVDRDAMNKLREVRG